MPHQPKKKVEDIANEVLTWYLQSWGQTNKRRLEAFAEAARYVGFTVDVREIKGEVVFDVPDEQSPAFEDFRQQIRGISRGKFENEIMSLTDIISSFRLPTPLKGKKGR